MGEKRKLGDMLIEAGLIDDFQLRRALSDQRQWRRPLGVTLVCLGMVEETEMTRVLSQQLRCHVVDLERKIASPEVVALLPYDVACRHHCLPLAVEKKGSIGDLYLGMFDPTDLNVIDEVSFRTGLKVRPVLVGDEQLQEAIQRSYRTGDPHGILTQITPEDIEDPDTAKHNARPAVAKPVPEPVPRTLAPESEPRRELKSKPGASQPLAPAGEPELVLTEGVPAPAPMGAFSMNSPESRRYVLQALVQLLISQDVIDPDELFKTIKSIAGERD